MLAYNFVGLGKQREEYLGQLKKETKKDSTHHALIQDLKKASQLGNLHRESVEIHFIDEFGSLIIKDVLVLSATERYVTFRGGVMIPIGNVKRVIV